MGRLAFRPGFAYLRCMDTDAVTEQDDRKREADSARWREAHREAIRAYNALIEAKGVPLADHRKF